METYRTSRQPSGNSTPHHIIPATLFDLIVAALCFVHGGGVI